MLGKFVRTCSLCHAVDLSPGQLVRQLRVCSKSHFTFRVLHVFIRTSTIDAVQIFGGRGLTVTGMGKLVENVSVLYLFLDRIPGLTMV